MGDFTEKRGRKTHTGCKYKLLKGVGANFTAAVGNTGISTTTKLSHLQSWQNWRCPFPLPCDQNIQHKIWYMLLNLDVRISIKYYMQSPIYCIAPLEFDWIHVWWQTCGLCTVYLQFVYSFFSFSEQNLDTLCSLYLSIFLPRVIVITN